MLASLLPSTDTRVHAFLACSNYSCVLCVSDVVLPLQSVKRQDVYIKVSPALLQTRGRQIPEAALVSSDGEQVCRTRFYLKKLTLYSNHRHNQSQRRNFWKELLFWRDEKRRPQMEMWKQMKMKSLLQRHPEKVTWRRLSSWRVSGVRRSSLCSTWKTQRHVRLTVSPGKQDLSSLS